MEPGFVIAGRYRLDHHLAMGGMGSVWRGFDLSLEREVAVKLLLRGLHSADKPAERFAREAKALARVRNPGCVEVYDVGQHQDGDEVVRFIVMELVEGESLKERLDRTGRLAPAEVMTRVAEAADALEAAHGVGIVHRDIKPGNLLIDIGERTRVVDFGISTLTDATRLTQSNAVLGTLPYVSPEQFEDKETIPASDIYALGAVAYECLTGRPPFAGENSRAVIHAHLFLEPEPLPETVPASVSRIVLRALAKDPDERWSSCAELAAACRAAADDPADAETGAAAAGAASEAATPVEPADAAAPDAEDLVAVQPDDAEPHETVPQKTVPQEEAPQKTAPQEEVPEGREAAEADETVLLRRRPRRGRRTAVVLAVVAVIALLGALIAWKQWPDGRGALDGSAPTSGTQAETTGPGDTSTPTAPTPTASPSETGTATASPSEAGETGGADPGGTETGGGDDKGDGEGDGNNGGGGDNGGSGETEEDTPTATVPDVRYIPYTQAVAELNAAGFANVDPYETRDSEESSNGFFPPPCEVVLQNHIGEDVDPATTISLGIFWTGNNGGAMSFCT